MKTYLRKEDGYWWVTIDFGHLGIRDYRFLTFQTACEVAKSDWAFRR